VMRDDDLESVPISSSGIKVISCRSATHNSSILEEGTVQTLVSEVFGSVRVYGR
jgi:hypothetical protein